jgi:hypothetical protein
MSLSPGTVRDLVAGWLKDGWLEGYKRLGGTLIVFDQQHGSDYATLPPSPRMGERGRG